MKFGVDRTDITPGYRTFMAGYGNRNDLSDGVYDPLTFTSLVLEENGRRVFIGAVDLVGVGRELSLKIRKNIAGLLGIRSSGVMINCSHTHGGMRVSPSKYLDCGPMMPVIRKNAGLLERKIYASVKRAAGRMRPGALFYGEGETSIPMNRRLKAGKNIENRPNPKGVRDASLKMLGIRDEKGRTAVLAARVSCHPVATGARHLVTADYPGAFRRVFEKYFPGAVAMFLQGTGADARPSHVAGAGKWRVMEHSELDVIGDCLFREVLEVMTSGMEPLGPLSPGSGTRDVVLPVQKEGSVKSRLEKMAEEADDEITKYCAGKILQMKKIPEGLPMTVQMIRFNEKFSMLGIAAEVLCGLGEKVESRVSSEFKMVNGYTNGAWIYLCDRKELARGGYEVSSHLLDLLPSPLSPELEDILVSAAAELDGELNGGKRRKTRA